MVPRPECGPRGPPPGSLRRRDSGPAAPGAELDPALEQQSRARVAGGPQGGAPASPRQRRLGSSACLGTARRSPSVVSGGRGRAEGRRRRPLASAPGLAPLLRPPPAPHSQAVPHSSVLQGHPRGALHVRPPTAPTEMLRPGGTPRTLARSHRCGTCRFALCPPRPGASCVRASGANVYTGAQGPKGFLSLETERSACQTRAAVPGKAPSPPASQN